MDQGISVTDTCEHCGSKHTGPCTPPRRPPVDVPPPLVKRRGVVLTCSDCSKVFKSRAKLLQHRYVHSGEKPFVCYKCQKGFSSKFRLVRHALIHSDETKYTCQVCSKQFRRKDHLDNHFKIHERVATFKCDQCSKEYVGKASYQKHKAVHSAASGDLKCRLCRYTGIDVEDILSHVKNRHYKTTQRERKHPCPSCGRRFYLKKEMWRHYVIHTGQRDFLCQFCPQAYRRHDHLLRHIRRRHPSPEVKVKDQVQETKPTLPNFKDTFQ